MYFCWYVYWSGVAASQIRYMMSSHRYWQTVFQRGWTNFPFYLQYLRALALSLQHLVLSFCFILVVLISVYWQNINVLSMLPLFLISASHLSLFILYISWFLHNILPQLATQNSFLTLGCLDL